MTDQPTVDEAWAEGLRNEIEGVLPPSHAARVGLTVRGGVLEVLLPSHAAVPDALCRLRDVVLRAVGGDRGHGMTVAAHGPGLVMACPIGAATDW